MTDPTLSVRNTAIISALAVLAAATSAGCSGDDSPTPDVSSSTFVRPTMPGAAPTTRDEDRSDKDISLYFMGAEGTPCAGKLHEHVLPASKTESSSAAALRLLTTTKAPREDVVNPWFGAKADPTVSVASSAAQTSLGQVKAENFGSDFQQKAGEQSLGHTLKKAVSEDGQSVETVKATIEWVSTAPKGVSQPWNLRPLPLPTLRAPIWIAHPAEGAKVAAHGFRVTGTATAPDGKLTFDVYQDGKSVKSGTPSAGADGTFGPMEIKPVLQPGTYELVVRQATPSPDFGSCTEVKRTFTLY